MFLNGLSRSYYMRDGSQRASGFFLILMCLPDGNDIRGLVRSVALRQSGHFMVGTVKINIASHVFDFRIEGTYGNNGLIRDVSTEVFFLGTPLPPELREAWNKGGGHNSAGSEAPLMDDWAKTLVYPASTYRKKR